MLQLVDYEYYTNTYKGISIPADSFDNYAIKASSKVNYYTFDRITNDNIDNNIKNTACEIADLIYSQFLLKEQVSNSNTIKTSETVGPHSVSYFNNINLLSKDILSNSELDEECYQICYRYLVHTGLMYRGV